MLALLIIIYLAFISLGLPDSLLGSAWPAMHATLGAPLAWAGAVSMIIAGGTILSSLASDRVIRRFGTGPVTLVSVGMTAVALLGMSAAGSFALLCLWAAPLGLGAGSVDVALNNFVALHYRARQMNWLHCFWGIGASAGPVIVSLCLAQRDSWSLGYRVIGLLQFALVAVLAGSLPLWRRVETAPEEAARTGVHLGIAALLRLPGAKPILLAFFCYCTLESTVGLWGSSYLVVVRGVEAEVAARWIALYYLGITLGRLGAGFLTARLAHRQMIRLGWVTVAVGIAILLLPAGGVAPVAGLFLIGLGCAPIFPSLLHGTPDNFGSAHSQAIMGIQMACAYLGTTLMPPLFGLLAARVGYALFPWYALGFLVLLAAMVEHFARSRGRGGAASAPPSR